MKAYNTNGTFTTTEHEKLTSEEREQVKELRRMHIGEHGGRRSWEFQMKMFDLFKKVPGVRVNVAMIAAAMLREVMFWEIKAEDRDFWVYRVVKCHKGCDPDPEHNCCWHKMGYSKRYVVAARTFLVDWGLLEYTSGKGLPSGFHNRTHYRVNHAGVMEFLENLPVQEIDPVVQHSRYERSNTVGTNGPTLTESTAREDDISLTESTPDGETLKSEDKELHEKQHDTSTPTTTAREPESLSVGEEIARYVHSELKGYYGSGLTGVEFSALVKDTNYLWRRGYRNEGTVDLHELYEAADWLVSVFESGDGRAYPPRTPDPLIVLAFEACGFGY